MNKELLIKNKTDEIFDFLEIPNRLPASGAEILDRSIRLYKYVVQNIDTNLQVANQNPNGTETSYEDELYKGLMQNSGLPTTNSIVLKHLLEKAGIECAIVILKSRTGGQHVSTIVKLEDSKYYYFDPTLEKSIYEEQNYAPEDLYLYVAAVGTEEYEQMYKPTRIIASEDQTTEILNNMADKSLSKILVNSISNRLPVLIYTNKENRKVACQTIRDENDELEIESL